jgi:superfamily II DNA or RNA helicase
MMIPVLSPVAGAISDTLRPALRPYQQELKDDIYAEWQRKPQSNVLAVLATGAGKTVLLSSIVTDEPGAVCVIAHRKELVSQISLALARNKVRHRIIGPTKIIKDIVRIHMEEVGHSYYDPSSKVAVAGIDTLILREEQLKDWMPAVKLWILDEAHHLLKNNKWGKGVTMFRNARGLGLTATPCRADGFGLGRHADGLFDSMKIGVTMRYLIDSGYLTKYRIFAPPSTFNRESIDVSKSTGDLNLDQMRKAVAGSSLVTHDEKTITGDVVAHYLKIAKGKLGITFVPDIATAEEVAQQFNAAGVSAAVVSSKTPDVERFGLMRKFKKREILQLVNVDLFGEGVDVPVNEVISMARPTESYSLYAQQFGRPLRLSPGKDFAIIIDHVGNVMRHGLPDAPREWSLDRRERRSGKSEPSTVRVCVACTAVYERYLDACPNCGEPVPKPAVRSGPSFVDGDLFELDAETLAQMRAEVVGARETPEAMRDRLTAQRVPVPGVMANVKRQGERIDALVRLDHTLSQWAGYRRAEGLSDSEIFRKFYLTYGVSWIEAQALKAAEANKLRQRIDNA